MVHSAAPTTPFPKIVHLDLKGAPPSLSYLRQLLPHLVSWGCTGLLLEYEDTFPYHGGIKVLRAQHAYNADELHAFLVECRTLRLEIIPLIQTFGHAEFILKHPSMESCREHPWFPNSLCPSNEQSFAVVAQMIDQIVEFHADVSTVLHIGCDEVHQLGICPLCEQRMAHRGWAKHRLFAEHVARVATYVKSRAPWRVLMWDDMLRGVNFGVNVQPTGLSSLVEPVVWYYGDGAVPDVWPSLSAFPGVWAATAFKGASGPLACTPDTALHVNNTKLWVAVLNDKSRTTSLGGVILTGWSRYDHYAVPCELLPAAIPSLSLCLHIVKCGAFNEVAHRTASNAVGFTGDRLMPVVQHPRPQPIDGDWSFPGSEIYVAAHRQANLLVETYAGFLDGDWLNGWCNAFNEQRGRVHLGMVRQLKTRAEELLCEWHQLRTMMSSSMLKMYSEFTVDEWLGCHVDTHVHRVERVLQRISKRVPNDST